MVYNLEFSIKGSRIHFLEFGIEFLHFFKFRCKICLFIFNCQLKNFFHWIICYGFHFFMGPIFGCWLWKFQFSPDAYGPIGDTFRQWKIQLINRNRFLFGNCPKNDFLLNCPKNDFFYRIVLICPFPNYPKKSKKFLAETVRRVHWRRTWPGAGGPGGSGPIECPETDPERAEAGRAKVRALLGDGTREGRVGGDLAERPGPFHHLRTHRGHGRDQRPDFFRFGLNLENPDLDKS